MARFYITSSAVERCGCDATLVNSARAVPLAFALGILMRTASRLVAKSVDLPPTPSQVLPLTKERCRLLVSAVDDRQLMHMLLTLLAVGLLTSAPQSAAQTITIDNVTIVDVANGRVQPRTSIVVEGKRIARIENASRATRAAATLAARDSVAAWI